MGQFQVNSLFLTDTAAAFVADDAAVSEGEIIMDRIPFYPMRFEPIYQYRLWGGRRLASLLSTTLPGDGPIGEAWLLSDRDDHPSLVAEGPLKGTTIAQLMEQSPEQMLGKLAGHFTRFPLLLKFLDVTQGLSVQVHPSDAHAELIPAGDTGKNRSVGLSWSRGPKLAFTRA